MKYLFIPVVVLSLSACEGVQLPDFLNKDALNNAIQIACQSGLANASLDGLPDALKFLEQSSRTFVDCSKFAIAEGAGQGVEVVFTLDELAAL